MGSIQQDSLEQYAGTRSWVSKATRKSSSKQATLAGPSRLPAPPSSAKERVQPVSSISAKDWDLDDLLTQHSPFKPVKRISATSSPTDIARAMAEHESSGEPLIIEDYHRRDAWPREMFSVEWLLQKHGDDSEALIYFIRLSLSIL